MPKSPQSAPDALLREADVAAEKFVAVARMLVAVALLIAVEFAFSRGPMVDVGVVEARTGARIVIGILFLTGALAYALLRFGFWSRWIAYVTVTIDILAIGLFIVGDLAEMGLPGRFAAAFRCAVSSRMTASLKALATCTPNEPSISPPVSLVVERRETKDGE